MKEKLNKKEAKRIAIEIIKKQLATTYYRLEDYENEYTQDEIDLISSYIDQTATRMLKIIKETYYTM